MIRLTGIEKCNRKLFNRQRIVPLILLLLIFSFFWVACREISITPPPAPESPGQPDSGPGSYQYNHEAVSVSSYGEEENQYWIFEPALPIPATAPLIVFNHGWTAVNPQSYGGWIEHIVRRGNIVVYPRYQHVTRFDEMPLNAINAVKDAIQKLDGENHVEPELENFAIVGHSLGGVITVTMAALADSEGLPEPKAIMPVEPGIRDFLKADLSLIPDTVLMVVIAGSEDTLVGDETSKIIFNQTPQIPLQNKDFVTVVSDYHGYPPLVADHYAPVAPDERYNMEGKFQGIMLQGAYKMLETDINALDYYGFWKLFDGLTDIAFYGKNREYALGNTPEQRFLGIWSDGTPVEELKITKTP